MGKILILRNATYTPPAGGNTGGGGAGPTNPVTPSLVDRLEAFFSPQTGMGSGNSYTSNATRAVLKDVPVADYFPSRSITIVPSGGTGYYLSCGTSNGAGTSISDFGQFQDAAHTYAIPESAVYISIAFRFNNNAGTAGTALSDFVSEITA